MQEVDFRFDLFPFCKYSSAKVISVEDEHPPIYTPSHNDSIFIFDETAMVSQSYLVDYLSDRHQILGDC